MAPKSGLSFISFGLKYQIFFQFIFTFLADVSKWIKKKSKKERKKKESYSFYYETKNELCLLLLVRN